MRNYEIILLLSPKLDDAAVDKACKDIEAQFTKTGGKFDAVDNKGKQRLGYEINDYRDAQYLVINATLDPASIAAAKKQIELNQSVLRIGFFVQETAKAN